MLAKDLFYFTILLERVKIPQQVSKARFSLLRQQIWDSPASRWLPRLLLSENTIKFNLQQNSKDPYSIYQNHLQTSKISWDYPFKQKIRGLKPHDIVANEASANIQKLKSEKKYF